MNNKELKDYTDAEIISEITRRIESFSLDANYLFCPLIIIGSQYLNWYNAEKQKVWRENKPTE